MRNYWACSKVADWIRGTPMGGAKSSEEWNEWHKQAKLKKIRYWLADTAIDKVENVVKYIPEKINSIRYYLNNRYSLRTNSLTAHKDDIKPGQWKDVGNRFLPCMFNELVDFVEIETAWMHVCFSDEARKEYNLPWWREQWYTRWFIQWRNAEAGVAHLEWASSLKCDENMGVSPDNKNYGKLTPQAINAIEILALYRWWKEDYKKRPDVYDVSGWTAYCNNKKDGVDRLFSEEKTKEEKKEVSRMLKVMHKMEDDYAKEDEEMMIRLIKIRDSLWT